MKERLAQIETPYGRMEAFVTHPEQHGPFPAVILFMDIWGLREELFDIARRIATVGYYCIVPDFYYRQGRIRFEFRNEHGRMLSHDQLDPARQEQVRQPMHALSNAMVVEDTGRLVEFLAGEPVSHGPIGSIGYCMGGRHALCAAGHYPARFVASASLHGTALVSNSGDSPHLISDKLRGEIYCGFAERDEHAPASTIRKLADLLADRTAVQYRYEVHPGTVHGYALPDRDVFHKQSANRDWELIFAMFHRQIPPYRN